MIPARSGLIVYRRVDGRPNKIGRVEAWDIDGTPWVLGVKGLVSLSGHEFDFIEDEGTDEFISIAPAANGWFLWTRDESNDWVSTPIIAWSLDGNGCMQTYVVEEGSDIGPFVGSGAVILHESQGRP